jgi:hypothetical protein
MLTTEQAAVYLGVRAPTLAAWRARGVGPAYSRYTSASANSIKSQGIVRYSYRELDAFIVAMRVAARRLPEPYRGRRRRTGVEKEISSTYEAYLMNGGDRGRLSNCKRDGIS